MNVKRLKYFIINPHRWLPALNYRCPRLLSWLDDEKCLRFWYRYNFHKKLNLVCPQTYNEKLQWLKLYDRKPVYTTMVDKYAAKKYVADIIGEEYIIPTLGVWDRFDDIDFESLPDQFVLKCTHDSGGVTICTDKSRLNVNAVRRKMNRCLRRDYYTVWREWPYKNVKPRIIAEKYMSEGHGEDMLDFKFMCFGGRVRCSFICSDRFSPDGVHVTFFDREWNKLPFRRHYPSSEACFEKPAQYEKMLEFAETLSNDLPFVRVDFYEIRGHLYFGELTLYPGSGLEEFTPEDWDYELGGWINLSEVKQRV